jgi:hypothetical protein
LELLLEKKSNRESFKQLLAANSERRLLAARVLEVKNSGIKDVVISRTLQDVIRRKWKQRHPNPIPRHIRDLDRFLSLVKAGALQNWRTRESAGQGRIYATEEDVEDALHVYLEIAEANELGLAPQVFEIFREVIQPIGTAKISEQEAITVGVSRQQILKEYYHLYHRPLSEIRLRQEILPPLDASGLISEERDPDNKSRNLVYPQVPATVSNARGRLPLASQNSGREVGVNETFENVPLLHPEVPRTPQQDASDASEGSMPHIVKKPYKCLGCKEAFPSYQESLGHKCEKGPTG